ncbi:3-phosphoshikimate 1-carboxyvinyltransferase [Devosia beringensis]|uniref:3-phosphoshikimate 1-carboxyvinyltransferase n=1 Tax=Devosia beringensis TaxID=2657486 RepID=UPI00186B8114|nr:3-phosphoshikimate 1-carboxyvinyltransferase [Devosia beringensis]
MTDTKTNASLLTAHGADPLSGRFVTPGDTAISQRALLLAALSVGSSKIRGVRASQAVLATAAALGQLGVRIEMNGPDWQVHGLGVLGLLAPDGPLQAGPGASNLALLAGLLAPYDMTVLFSPPPALEDGTATTLEPLPPALLDGLGALGARVEPQEDGGLKLVGACLPVPLRLDLEQPDETSKSALLLAGLQVAGESAIHERVATHDHGEKLLAAFGADINVTPDEGDSEGVTIRLNGLPALQPLGISVPGDPSAAAFAIVAALIIKGSELVVANVLINPLRTGLIDTLLEMGGDIQFINQRETAGEHIADLRVRSSWLKGIRISERHGRALLDDIAPLAIAAAFAQGETVINGLGGRNTVQDSRLKALVAGLRTNKVGATLSAESLSLVGDGKVAGGSKVDSQGDGSLAMSFAVLGLASRHKVTIKGAEAIADSFPDFVAAMSAAGGKFPPTKTSKT